MLSEIADKNQGVNTKNFVGTIFLSNLTDKLHYCGCMKKYQDSKDFSNVEFDSNRIDKKN